MPARKKAKIATSTKKGKANVAPTPTRRSSRRATHDSDDVPDMYKTMLADLPKDEHMRRPAKRRKVSSDSDDSAARRSLSPEFRMDGTFGPPYFMLEEQAKSKEASVSFELTSLTTDHQSCRNTPRQQIILDDATDSDGSEEFEDVEIQPSSASKSSGSSNVQGIKTMSLKDLNLSFERQSTTRTFSRKKITKADRLHRLAVHKWHYLCLLMHMATVNKWCNDSDIQTSLKQVAPRILINRLHREGTQAERKFSFDKAIVDIGEIWMSAFKRTESGAVRAKWRDLQNLNLADEMEDAPEPIDFEDFKQRAKIDNRHGSRDLGVQLFCALCRGLAIDARLVCSLQVLPFAMTDKSRTSSGDSEYIQGPIQNYGLPVNSLSGPPSNTIRDARNPTWWVEVLNPAIDQWIAFDPMNFANYNRPRTKFEPSGSDPLNSMAYVIAFEEDGTAKDVTRRYASAFNAKTRKLRVESTKNGEKWLQDVMSFFAKHDIEPRDQIEDAELSRRVGLEGMPRNVQDFKDHPVYVLERHLRSNEVIEPKKECGRLRVGRESVETVYRRESVHICHSADGWHRKGRNVREGVQPALYKKKNRTSTDEDDGEEEGFAALYAEYQTEVYIPQAVQDGRIPRNAFGNLDIYVPTMIPMGAAHVRHPFAVKAAKALGIEHVEAVTGFKFQGRKGTAIMNGIIIAVEHVAVLKEVISAIEKEAQEKNKDERNAIFEKLWRQMFHALKIRERIQREHGGGEVDDEVEDAAFDQTKTVDSDMDRDHDLGLEDEYEDEKDDDDDLTYDDTDQGGGFTAGIEEAVSDTGDTAIHHALVDQRPTKLPPLINHQDILITISPHRPKPTLSQQDSHNDLFDGEMDDEKRDDSDLDRNTEWGGMLRDEEPEVEGGGFITTPQDSPGSWDSGLGSNMQEVVSGWYTDYMMDPADLPIHDYVSEITPSPEPDQGSALEANAVERLGNTPARAQISATTDSTRDRGHEVEETASTLSHDPDEDDAEPEWVADAFEE